MNRRQISIGMALFVIVLLLLLAGCGGAATPSTGTGVTPPSATGDSGTGRATPPRVPTGSGVIATVVATPAATVQTPVAPDPAKAVESEFARLEKGRIMYNPPTEMTEGQRERIEVRIAQSDAVTLTEGLRGSGAPQIEAIAVASFMKVRLLGEGFTITPLSSEEQVVAGADFTQWTWDVTPTQAGDLSLTLVVTARVKLAGFSDEQKDLGIIERNIKVKVDPAYSLQAFFDANRDWIFPAVFIPVAAAGGGALWRRYAARRVGRSAGGQDNKG